MPDAETFKTLLLIKRASELRTTYQIRLLTYKALQESKMLIIEVPKKCKIHESLLELKREYPQTLKVVRT